MFIIKGLYHGSTCYYIDSKIDANTGLIVRTFTPNIETATKFRTIKKAQATCDELHEPFFKVYPLCLICHKEIIGYPALSRHDNKTQICSTCGVNQSIADLFNYLNEGDYEDE